MLAVAGLTSPGCAHLDNTEKGAIAGGAIGTGVGLGVGALTGSPRTGAAVGGLLGAGTGAIVGNEQDRRDDRERDRAFAQAGVTTQQQRLGITDVIRLAQDGHEDEVIINQIRTTGSTFPALTASDLSFLKTNGVSGRVIAEMQTSRAVAPRVVVREPRPVFVHEPPPVVVVPHRCYPPRPVFVAGGCWHH
ncbi:MAG: hypothetical protein C0501_09945 [Isosphaera sp.]|nr:hypothetical protein [Isosphaera sp.]